MRPATKEQVESLGAKFVAVEDEEFKQAETSGGYAKEMSDAYKAKQAALVASHIAKQDIVITTALIPGRPAPKLVSADMVASMRPGSVVMDLAVERGGNCELSRPGEVVDSNGVKIVGYLNVAGRLAATASSLYARNLFAFVETLIDKDTKTVKVDPDDELVRATCLTRDGAGRPSEFPAQGRLTRAARPKQGSRAGPQTLREEMPAWPPTRRSRSTRRRRPPPMRPSTMPTSPTPMRCNSSDMGGGSRPCGERRRHRSLRVPPRHLRHGGVRRLLRGLVRDARRCTRR